jgi:RNA polymerase sigma factor (TIGR02999 family)
MKRAWESDPVPPPRNQSRLSEQPQTTVTLLLAEARQGRPEALGRLFPLVYDQLHSLARVQRHRLPAGDTLNTTALVHEAFIKLAGTASIGIQDRAHFMAVAATAMRQILIGYARRGAAQKRGSGKSPISLQEVESILASEPGSGNATLDALVALDGALTDLSRTSDRQRRVVECRFFGGMSIEETALALAVSPATVKRDWSMAQAWLYRHMQEALQ